MSSLARWDPYRDMTSLHDAMNQLFEQAVMRPEFGRWGASGGRYGAMNVWEADGKYYCQVLLPGVEPDGMEISARQNTLTVKATLPEPLAEEQLKTANFLVREFGSGEFVRSITLPKDVKGDAIEAGYEHGVLTLQIPQAEHVQPRRINVRSGALKPSQKTSQVVEEQQAPTAPTADAKAASNASFN